MEDSVGDGHGSGVALHPGDLREPRIGGKAGGGFLGLTQGPQFVVPVAFEFSRGEPIYLPADEARSVFLLAEGRAKICHLTPEGKQSILAFIDPGELFGELALLDAPQRDEYAEAVERSTVVMIPAAAMQELMERFPNVSLGVTKLFGFRRQRIERRLKNLLFLSNRERLTHLLLELVEQYGSQTTEGIRLGW